MDWQSAAPDPNPDRPDGIAISPRPHLDGKDSRNRNRFSQHAYHFVVHEHFIRPISSLVGHFLPANDDCPLTLRIKKDALYKKPQTLHLFVHWLYHNEIPAIEEEPIYHDLDMDIEDIKDKQLWSKIKGVREVFPQFSIGACKDALEKKRCQFDDALQLLADQEVLPNQQERTQLDNSDFSHLLDLYFLAAVWDIPVLKNAVIDHLIDASFNHEISLNRSKDIYRCTEEGDQLLRLWTDFHLWQIHEARLRFEADYHWLHHAFLRDLNATQIAIRDKPVLDTPLSQADPAAYHQCDEGSGRCCRRSLFEGDGYEHRRRTVDRM